MRKSAIFPLAWLVFGAVAHAQTAPPNNESVTVTATRVPTPADEVAAGVTVLDAATLREAGDTTLADALSGLPGMDLVQSGGPGSDASLFIRGADSDQVQVLIDGVPVNDPSGPGGAYNFGVETLSDVARIEVVRGPMSAVYGSGAVGGVVNIVTDRGSGPFGVSAMVAGGYPASLVGQLTVHGARGAFDYALSAETQSYQGYDDTPRREAVYTGAANGFRTGVLAADFGYTPVAGTRFYVDARGRESVNSYDEQGAPAFDANNNTGRDNDSFVRAGVNSLLFGGWWLTNVSLGYDQAYRHYVTFLLPNDPNQQQDDSRYTGTRFDTQWNNTLRVPNFGPVRQAVVTAGYEHSNDTAQERLNSAYYGYPYIARVNATDHRDSVYAGAQGSVFSRAVISGNVREEGVSGVGDAFTWRAGISYAVPALATHLKASLGTAFLAPSLYDRYGIDNAGYVGNPMLRPERSRSEEIGFVTRAGKYMSVSATWFHTRTRDLIETVFAPVYTTVNVNAARMQGVETALTLHPARWLDADLSYTYTDARNTGTGQLLLRRPYDTGAMTLRARPVTGLTLVPTVRFIGADLDEIVNNQGYSVGVGKNPGGVTFDLAITYQATPRWQVFAYGKNLNDARYEPASGYALPGPSFLAGVRFAE